MKFPVLQYVQDRAKFRAQYPVRTLNFSSVLYNFPYIFCTFEVMSNGNFLVNSILDITWSVLHMFGTVYTGLNFGLKLCPVG